MALPVPSVYTKSAPTFFKGTRMNAGFTTNSGTYVNITGYSPITSVPDTSKILWTIKANKVTAGTGSVKMTDDGTLTFGEVTGIPTAGVTIFNSDGSDTQDKGSASTVRMQAKSSDANNINFNANSNFFVVTDGDVPMIITGPGIAAYKIPMRISVSKLFIYYSGHTNASSDVATIMGILSYEEDLNDSSVRSSELTITLPNEQIFSYMEIILENVLQQGQFFIFDWSGHGVSFA